MSEGLTMSQLQERNALLVTENKAIKAQRDALAVECASLKDYLKDCSVIQGEGNWTSDTEKSVYVPALDWMTPTTVTDAYLKSVRAEGVETLTEILQVMIEAGDFSGDVVGAIAGAIDAGNCHAAQLRAGKDGE